MLLFVLFSACLLFLKQCRTTAEVKLVTSQTWGKPSVQFALLDLQGVHCLARATTPLQHQWPNCGSVPPRAVLARLTHRQVIYRQCCQMMLCIRDQTWGRGQQNGAGRPRGPEQVPAHPSAQRSSSAHRPPGREGRVKPSRAHFACRKWKNGFYQVHAVAMCFDLSGVVWEPVYFFFFTLFIFFFPCLTCEFHIRY